VQPNSQISLAQRRRWLSLSKGTSNIRSSFAFSLCDTKFV